MAEKTDAVLTEAYLLYDRSFRMNRLRIGCIVSLLLMPAGSILDIFVYPSLVIQFLFIRLGCDVMTACLLLFSYTSLGYRNVVWLGLSVAMLPSLSMCMMVYASEGVASPYYAGLNLVFFAAGTLMPWPLRETLGLCLSSIFFYILACFFHGRIEGAWDTFYNNLYFVVLTTVICATASYYVTKKRFEEFRLRYELARSNERLEELDRLKSEFFANVSHELRTPMTLIISPLQDAIRNESLPSGAREVLKIALEHSMRLMRLINDLLELVRIGKGRGHCRMRLINLSSFVPGMVDSVRYLARMKKQTIHSQGEENRLMVLGDPDKLEKAMLNLLTNSIKFTPTGGSITARLLREGTNAVVEIEDTGIGIPTKDLPFIFDRFRQVDGSSTRRFQGLGIGLALAKSIVEEHKGALGVRSEQGKGSVFRLEIPLGNGPFIPEELSEDSNNEIDPLSKMYQAADRKLGIRIEEYRGEIPAVGAGEFSILIVEDEPDMRRFLVSILHEQCRVLQAVDGEAGLAMVRKYKPDLVLLDLMLPRMDGLELCATIKNDRETRNTKVVLLTARVDEESKISALERGADDFMTKPFSTTEVKVRITNLLRAAQLEEKMRKRYIELEDTLRRLKETEAQLVQSEKMNAMGNLSAGLIHEINNPLNFTLTAIQMAVKEAENSSPDLKETLEDIGNGMTRIRDIVSDLRTFVHPTGEMRPQPFIFAEAFHTALRLVSHEIRDLQVVNLVQNGKVCGSKNQIIQVFVNLLVNSAQALRSRSRDGGCSPQIRLSSATENQRLFIKIWDNGCGISPKNLSKVFDPFFTTREVGEGMGLGLSVCHTIIMNHQGKITVDSKEGEWTEVTFDLPLAEEE